MHKFKVGDKVKIIDAMNHDNIGKIGIVEQLSSSYPLCYKLKIDGKSGSWGNAWLQSCLDEFTETKEDKMEKYNINITIEVKDGMEFDRKFIKFLEENTKEYELELNRIYTEEEEYIIKGLIGKMVRSNNKLKYQQEDTLPITKQCEYCTYFCNRDIRCHTSGIKLNKDKIVDKCYYSK